MTADVVVALVLVALAAAYLVARGVRVLRRRGAGGCGCGDAKAGGCGAAGGPTAEELRRAAQRGAGRAASK